MAYILLEIRLVNAHLCEGMGGSIFFSRVVYEEFAMKRYQIFSFAKSVVVVKLCDDIISCFANEESGEATRSVVPLESLSVAVPHLQTVLLFAILIHEVVWFTSVPVFECDRSSR